MQAEFNCGGQGVLRSIRSPVSDPCPWTKDIAHTLTGRTDLQRPISHPERQSPALEKKCVVIVFFEFDYTYNTKSHSAVEQPHLEPSTTLAKFKSYITDQNNIKTVEAIIAVTMSHPPPTPAMDRTTYEVEEKVMTQLRGVTDRTREIKRFILPPTILFIALLLSFFCLLAGSTDGKSSWQSASMMTVRVPLHALTSKAHCD